MAVKHTHIIGLWWNESSKKKIFVALPYSFFTLLACILFLSFVSGFPFNSDDEYKAQIGPFLNFEQPEPAGSDITHSLHEGDSVLLMTHVGPHGSGVALRSSFGLGLGFCDTNVSLLLLL